MMMLDGFAVYSLIICNCVRLVSFQVSLQSRSDLVFSDIARIVDKAGFFESCNWILKIVILIQLQ